MTPERWSLTAGDSGVATLTIPADARRERRFEIACAMTVTVPDDAQASGAWHRMTVQANGEQQWRRQVPSANAGAWDGLDYRFSRSVPVGQVLRVTVTVATQRSRRRTLVIEADELL